MRTSAQRDKLSKPVDALGDGDLKVVDASRRAFEGSLSDHGQLSTKRLVLAAYDAMRTAAAIGATYRSPLDAPPGRGARHVGGPS